MGYTHYFRQNRAPTLDQWRAIAGGFKSLIGHAEDAGDPLPIQREYDEVGAPEITEERIVFNGIGDAGHETMLLERDGRGFQFCKTARKPYDRAVIALLILADRCAPGCWQVSSDGDPQDWKPILDWMDGLGLGLFELPAGVRS